MSVPLSSSVILDLGKEVVVGSKQRIKYIYHCASAVVQLSSLLQLLHAAVQLQWQVSRKVCACAAMQEQSFSSCRCLQHHVVFVGCIMQQHDGVLSC